MVNVKDQEIFNIIIPQKEMTSESCPYLTYPANIHGCEHSAMHEYAECGKKSCPIAVSEPAGDGD